MKTYRIKVNGKLYEVELESVTESDKKVEAPAAPAPTPAAAPAEGTKVNAPMQGTILKTNAVVGQKVAKGTLLAVLEAMKLENEILAPADGVVKSVLVAKGQKVDAGQLLMVIG
jgi:biotin carboxyl carrier protein